MSCAITDSLHGTLIKNKLNVDTFHKLNGKCQAYSLHK